MHSDRPDPPHACRDVCCLKRSWIGRKQFLVLAMLVAVAACAEAQVTAKNKDSAPDAARRVYPAPTNLKVLPKDMTGQQVHDLMEQWVGDVGVRCSACHDDGGEGSVSGGESRPRYADDSKPMKEVARRMYTMTDAINVGFLAKIDNSGMPITCGTCHQGRIIPAPGASLAAGEPAEGHPAQTARPQPCLQCHEDERASFSLPFRHKVEEGLISCTDCHEPHGANGQARRLTPAEVDRICTKCHTETAGPFVYEHAIIKTEGCTACHAPHGGLYPHMLNRAKVDTICQLCHYPSRTSLTGAPVNHAHDMGAQSKPCTACHSEIHGSNVSAVFSVESK